MNGWHCQVLPFIPHFSPGTPFLPVPPSPVRHTRVNLRLGFLNVISLLSLEDFMYPLPGILTCLAYSYSCFRCQVFPLSGTLPVSISCAAPVYPPVLPPRYSPAVIHQLLPQLWGLRWTETAPVEFTPIHAGPDMYQLLNKDLSNEWAVESMGALANLSDYEPMAYRIVGLSLCPFHDIWNSYLHAVSTAQWWFC